VDLIATKDWIDEEPSLELAMPINGGIGGTGGRRTWVGGVGAGGAGRPEEHEQQRSMPLATIQNFIMTACLLHIWGVRISAEF
jgi:hypothetical protein